MNSSSHTPAAHLDEELADFVLGRLPARQHEQWLSHLAGCNSCRDLVATAQSLRAEEEAHLSTDRVAELADSALAVTENEHAHLEQCAVCAGELAMLRRIEAPQELSVAREENLRTVQTRRTTPFRPGRRSARRFAVPAGLVALAASLLLLILPRDGEQSLLTPLAHFDPLPVRVTRSAAEPGSMDEARLLGLAAYREQNWSEAAEQLETATKLGGGPEVQLYLASAHALRGDDRSSIEWAASVLRDSASTAGLREEARWLHLQLALRAEDLARVRQLLAEIEAGDGRRAEQARALLARIDGTNE